MLQCDACTTRDIVYAVETSLPVCSMAVTLVYQISLPVNGGWQPWESYIVYLYAKDFGESRNQRQIYAWSME